MSNDYSPPTAEVLAGMLKCPEYGKAILEIGPLGHVHTPWFEQPTFGDHLLVRQAFSHLLGISILDTSVTKIERGWLRVSSRRPVPVERDHPFKL